MDEKEIPEGYDEGNVHAFLSELSALSRKFGIAIHGCEGYGSPAIYGLKNSPSLPHGFGYENLQINEETGFYTVGRELLRFDLNISILLLVFVLRF